MAEDSSLTTHRSAQLDGLRALAVLAVLVQHSWASGTARYGAYGVYLFFVLSGFLISRILLNARGEAGSLRAFYIRRALRIFPIYYGVLLVAFVLGEPQVRLTAPWLFTYTENFYHPFTGHFALSPVNHLWSLAVEEQFYLVWPILVLAASRTALPWLFGAAILCGPLSRVLLLAASHRVDELPFSYLDSLALGAWLALSTDRKRWSHMAGRVGAIGLAVVAVSAALGRGAVVEVVEPLAFSLVAVWLIAGAERGFSGVGGRLLACRPLVALGTVSYGMYLYHPFVANLLDIDLQRGPVKFLAYAASTIAAATVSWFLIERPVQSLKKHFPMPRTSRAGSAAPVRRYAIPISSKLAVNQAGHSDS